MPGPLDRLKNFAKSSISEGVPVPITSAILRGIFRSSKIEGVSNVDVVIDEQSIQIRGTAVKLIPIPFSVTLVPNAADDRKMYFTVTALKPLNAEWIRAKVFNVPPILAYENDVVGFDLNGIDAIAKIPIGTIRSFKLTSNTLWVSLGV